MDVCFRVLKERNKSRFDSYSVRNSVLIISHITFRDCRVHIFPTTFLEIAVYSLCGFLVVAISKKLPASRRPIKVTKEQLIGKVRSTNEIIAIVIITGRVRVGCLEQERKKLNRGLNRRIPSLLHCFALAGYGTEHRGVAETLLCLYIVF